jgi:predicted DCC family thiol-disulfide oxidoreductase YuxK
MTGSRTQAPPDGRGVHLILYDGVCGLCHRLVQFVLRHDVHGVFSFAPLQSATAQAMVAQWGGHREAMASFYVVADFRTPHARALTRSDGALFVASQLGWPWTALRMAKVLPKALRNWLYNVIAHNRYRIFGRYDHCLLPGAEDRSRFVE